MAHAATAAAMVLRGTERRRKGGRRGEEDEYAACPAALAAVECSACTHLGRGGEGIEGRMDIAAGRSLLQSIEKEFLLYKDILCRVSVWSGTHLGRTIF